MTSKEYQFRIHFWLFILMPYNLINYPLITYSMSVKQNFRSSWKSLFHILLVTITIMLAAYAYLLWYSYRANTQTLASKNKQIVATQKIIESKWAEENFIKLELARNIENNEENINWKSYVEQIISIVQEIKSTNYVWSNAITLSDLNIDKNHLTLKWKVTNLILLYHSVPEKNYKSLIDRFSELEFINSLKIQEYKKVWNLIEFSLDADISLENAKF